MTQGNWALVGKITLPAIGVLGTVLTAWGVYAGWSGLPRPSLTFAVADPVGVHLPAPVAPPSAPDQGGGATSKAMSICRVRLTNSGRKPLAAADLPSGLSLTAEPGTGRVAWIEVQDAPDRDGVGLRQGQLIAANGDAVQLRVSVLEPGEAIEIAVLCDGVSPRLKLRGHLTGGNISQRRLEPGSPPRLVALYWLSVFGVNALAAIYIALVRKEMRERSAVRRELDELVTLTEASKANLAELKAMASEVEEAQRAADARRDLLDGALANIDKALKERWGGARPTAEGAAETVGTEPATADPPPSPKANTSKPVRRRKQ